MSGACSPWPGVRSLGPGHGEHAPHLDGSYAAFGRVIEGMDAVDRIAATKTNIYNDKPLQKQIMKKVTVDTFGEEYPEPEKL